MVHFYYRRYYTMDTKYYSKAWLSKDFKIGVDVRMEIGFCQH